LSVIEEERWCDQSGVGFVIQCSIEALETPFEQVSVRIDQKNPFCSCSAHPLIRSGSEPEVGGVLEDRKTGKLTFENFGRSVMGSVIDDDDFLGNSRAGGLVDDALDAALEVRPAVAGDEDGTDIGGSFDHREAAPILP